jgi:hypothetical protein
MALEVRYDFPNTSKDPRLARQSAEHLKSLVIMNFMSSRLLFVPREKGRREEKKLVEQLSQVWFEPRGSWRSFLLRIVFLDHDCSMCDVVQYTDSEDAEGHYGSRACLEAQGYSRI